MGHREDQDENSTVNRDEKGRWRPGESGNPNGSPVGSVGLSTRIKTVLLTKQGDKLLADVLAEVMVKEALKSPQKMWGFLKEFMDRDEGRTDKLDALHGMEAEEQAEQLRRAMAAMDSTVPEPDDGG
jgi:hypothetical protein